MTKTICYKHRGWVIKRFDEPLYIGMPKKLDGIWKYKPSWNPDQNQDVKSFWTNSADTLSGAKERIDSWHTNFNKFMDTKVIQT